MAGGTASSVDIPEGTTLEPIATPKPFASVAPSAAATTDKREHCRRGTAVFLLSDCGLTLRKVGVNTIGNPEAESPQLNWPVIAIAIEHLLETYHMNDKL
jgi:hypothetical protein